MTEIQSRENRSLARRIQQAFNSTPDEASIHDDSPPAVFTVASWIKKWIQSGFSSTVLMPRLKPSRIRDAEDDDLLRIINAAIRKVYLNRQRNSIASVQAEVTLAVAEYNCTAEYPLTVPGTETIRRLVHRIDAYQIDVARHGKVYANRRHRAPGRAFHTTEPLELVMADGQVMDVIVRETNDDGTPGRDIGRPFITVMLDVHTRCVLGAYVSLAPFCGGTLLKTMSGACVPHLGWPSRYSSENDHR